MSRPALAAGARAAGAVIVAGYVTGLVGGSLLGPIAGFLLISFGRQIEADPTEVGPASMATVAFVGAVVVAAFRWNTVELGPIRGAQGVLGPTLLVGPTVVALAAWIAAVGGVLALAAWSTSGAAPAGVLRRSWGSLEAGVVGAILASGYWGPALVDEPTAGQATTRVAGWLAASVIAGGLGLAAPWVAQRLPRWFGWAAAVTSTLAVAGGAVLMATEL